MYLGIEAVAKCSLYVNEMFSVTFLNLYANNNIYLDDGNGNSRCLENNSYGLLTQSVKQNCKYTHKSICTCTTVSCVIWCVCVMCMMTAQS